MQELLVSQCPFPSFWYQCFDFLWKITQPKWMLSIKVPRGWAWIQAKPIRCSRWNSVLGREVGGGATVTADVSWPWCWSERLAAGAWTPRSSLTSVLFQVWVTISFYPMSLQKLCVSLKAVRIHFFSISAACNRRTFPHTEGAFKCILFASPLDLWNPPRRTLLSVMEPLEYHPSVTLKLTICQESLFYLPTAESGKFFDLKQNILAVACSHGNHFYN